MLSSLGVSYLWFQLCTVCDIDRFAHRVRLSFSDRSCFWMSHCISCSQICWYTSTRHLACWSLLNSQIHWCTSSGSIFLPFAYRCFLLRCLTDSTSLQTFIPHHVLFQFPWTLRKTTFLHFHSCSACVFQHFLTFIMLCKGEK